VERLELGLILGLSTGLMIGAIIGLVIGFSFAPDVTKLEEKISQMETTVYNLENVVVQKNHQINLLQDTILSKETEINNLQNIIHALHNQTADLQIELDNRNDVISSLQGQVDSLNLQLEELLEEMIEVFPLTDKEYYDSVKNDLQNADETILVAMYSIAFDPQNSSALGSILVDELVNAKDRGVNITVIIEYKTRLGYMDVNLEAYNYLEQNGVNVILDSMSDTDHMSLVIIDDEIVYVGSHDWSESGLKYNREASVKIISKEIANVFKQYLEDR
jgi:phosphatidylserine/phosphatidylglycerophosphate/cardiolipin synthase-like enzyme